VKLSEFYTENEETCIKLRVAKDEFNKMCHSHIDCSSCRFCTEGDCFLAFLKLKEQIKN
jgi:hypothetical protein